MLVVQPIRDENQIRAIKGALKKDNPRYYLMWVIGTNLGLRISDILKLKVKDVQDQRGNIRDSLEFTEQKTGKNRDIELNQEVKEALQYFFKKTGVFDLDEFIFRDSRNTKNKENKPISRTRAYQVINKYARQAGVQTKVGTHTLRKIFGTHARKQGIPIELVSEALGHRNIEVTKRYLGITNDEVKKAFKNFKI